MNNPNQNDLNAVMQRGYTVDIGGFITRGWEILQEDMGNFIGFTLLMAGILVAFGIVVVAMFITIIGIPFAILAILLAGPLVIAPLSAGFFVFAFKKIKRQPTEFSDFFKGFQNNNFLPIFLSSLVISLITAICSAPGQVVNYISVFSSIGSESYEPSVFLQAISAILSLVGSIASACVTAFYSFSVPFIVARKMPFWTAMEASRKLVMRQWFGIFLLLIVLTLINIAGLIPCGLGLLLTVPLTSCVIAAAYESIVGLPTSDLSQA
ncbi:MAG: DUF975 family protein [Cyanobacteria bacterium P01_A01_bin.17]